MRERKEREIETSTSFSTTLSCPRSAYVSLSMFGTSSERSEAPASENIDEADKFQESCCGDETKREESTVLVRPSLKYYGDS